MRGNVWETNHIGDVVDIRPIQPPPLPVGDEVFFQVPELEQLPAGNYKCAGACNVLWQRRGFRFYVLRNEERFVVARTLEAILPGQTMRLRGGSIIPPAGNFHLKAVPLSRLPTGSYRLIGSGSLKEYGDVSPTQIYVLENAGQFLAVKSPVKHVAFGSLLEIVRKGRVLTVGVDRRVDGQGGSLNEDMIPTRNSVYEWIDGSFVLLQHIPPDQPKARKSAQRQALQKASP